MSAAVLVAAAAGCAPSTTSSEPEPVPGTNGVPEEAGTTAGNPAIALPDAEFAIAARFPAAERLVAIGDIHGDIEAFRQSLIIGGITDEEGNWIAGETVFVQCGDQLDRGDGEPEILDLLDALEAQAAAAGGAVHVLNGNHEVMNVAGDLRYVTEDGFADYAQFDPGEGLDDVPQYARGRVAAYAPGGPEAIRLADNEIIVMVGDTVFVHGGVLASHVEYGVDRINDESERWMLGEIPMPAVLVGELSPVWTRIYSSFQPDCDELNAALDALHAERMVVGHTVQQSGITSACDGRVWRIDTGMSSYYGGTPQALEITDEGVSVLR